MNVAFLLYFHLLGIQLFPIECLQVKVNLFKVNRYLGEILSTYFIRKFMVLEAERRTSKAEYLYIGSSIPNGKIVTFLCLETENKIVVLYRS